MNKYHAAAVVFLWLFAVAPVCVPAIFGTFKEAVSGRGMRRSEFIVLAVLVVLMTQSVGRAIADKGGTTNPPPAAPRGVIRLYTVNPLTGKLVPLGAPIRETTP